jgi:glycine/D-amino acid oxidase-like deaminating enzyme
MITPEKKLRSGRSVWNVSPGRAIARQRLKRSEKVDVAIIGAGVSGAFMAHSLAPRYDKVVILDRRAPASGSTSASTAMLQFEIDVPLIRLREKKIGSLKAARAWKRSYQATQKLVRLIRDENIHCGLERRHALYLTGTDMGARAMEHEKRARNRAGIPGIFLSRKDLWSRFGIDRAGAILSPGCAVADPVRLTAGLLRRAIKAGARLYAPENVASACTSQHGVVLDTGTHFIEARYAIFCTGYEVLKGLPARGTKITSSWAMATGAHAPHPAWLDKIVMWEASTPYLYLRTTTDGRVIVGGEDEDIDLPSYRARSIPHKTARLIAKTKVLIPEMDLRAVFSWTGAFGESRDGLPFIDAVPGMPGCFAVMGFGGNGTIYSKIAAEMMPSLMEGRRPRDADLYEFRQ